MAKPTKTELLVIVIVLLLVALLCMSLERHDRAPSRVLCAANLRQVAIALAIYADANEHSFPIVLPPAVAGTYAADFGVRVPAGSATEAVAAAQGPAARGNISAVLWVVVQSGFIPPKCLICNADPYHGEAAATTMPAGGQYLLTPARADQLSYSISYPWVRDERGVVGPAPWWRSPGDSSLPLVSDMALWGSDLSKRGKELNSPNHGGEGQNVVFGDDHVEWARTPKCGQGGESIFHSGAPGAETSQVVPTVNPVTMPDGSKIWDTLMVPMRDRDGRLH